MIASEPTRPRFGVLTRRNGDRIQLVFHPTDDPNVFAGVRADTEKPVGFSAGDSFTVDVIGAGQSVTLALEEDAER